MQANIQFPQELESFVPFLEKTKKKYLKISNKRNAEVQVWQSKFAGTPFLPLGVEYPKDSEGKPLYLLAQLNFEEIPPIENFPTKGILQFYIADDDLYGMDFDAPAKQNKFRVLYFPEIDKEDFQRDTPSLKPELTPFLDGLQAHQITFELLEEYAGLSDATIEATIGEKIDEFNDIVDANNYKVMDWFYDELSNSGHKIGGYAHFTQEDPRKYDVNKFNQYNTLLFQMDSIEGICWGDIGIANFFINLEKLKNLDFSDVLYNWDCG